MKKLVIAFFAILLVTVFTLMMYFNSNIYYSKRLVSSILSENIDSIIEIISKRPDSINTYPSLTTRWWHSAMNWRILYPLNQACSVGNEQIINYLLENGADVNCNDGLTPLSITYSLKKEGWYDIANLLIEHGADLNYSTEYSGRRLSIFSDIVRTKAQYDNGEDEDNIFNSFIYTFNHLDSRDKQNVDWLQVLRYSLINDRVRIISFLFDEKLCEINECCYTLNTTPLMFAVKNSSASTVYVILGYNPNIAASDSNGKTAYDYAIEKGYYELAEMIKP